MAIEHINLHLVLLLTIGFMSASLFGYIALRLKMSAIIGYLVGGFLIGPYSPVFVANPQLAESLAEIGVILMMFSVGMQFRWRDVIRSKKVTIPGGLLQTAAITMLGLLLFVVSGFSLEAGLVFGICLGVASTVVLVRQLMENRLLHTPQGKLCMGWLIIEDKIAVVSLLLLPLIANGEFGEGKLLFNAIGALLYLFIKFFLVIYLLYLVGKRIAGFVIEKVEATSSRELFTITILALAFMFTGFANLCGISIVIGAYLAGIVIGEINMHDKVTAHILPIKEAFIVLFFLAMGMLFDVRAIFSHFTLFALTLGIILVAKPVSAYFITKGFNRSKKEALTVAFALAQIGEFSFILAEEATRYKIFPDYAYDLIVATALISIAINPFLFKRISQATEG